MSWHVSGQVTGRARVWNALAAMSGARVVRHVCCDACGAAHALLAGARVAAPVRRRSCGARAELPVAAASCLQAVICGGVPLG